MPDLTMGLDGGAASPAPPSRAVVTREYAAQMKIVLARMAGAIDRVAAILGPSPDVSALYHGLGWLEGGAEMLAQSAPWSIPPAFRIAQEVQTMYTLTRRPTRAPCWLPQEPPEKRRAYDG